MWAVDMGMRYEMVQAVALKLGWTYDMHYDLFRKRLPNGDELGLPRSLVSFYSGHSMGEVTRWIQHLENGYLEHRGYREKGTESVSKLCMFDQ